KVGQLGLLNTVVVYMPSRKVPVADHVALSGQDWIRRGFRGGAHPLANVDLGEFVGEQHPPGFERHADASVSVAPRDDTHAPWDSVVLSMPDMEEVFWETLVLVLPRLVENKTHSVLCLWLDTKIAFVPLISFQGSRRHRG